MSIESGLTAFVQAVGTDIKGLSPKIVPPVEIFDSYTLTDADSGKHLVYNGNSSIILTFPGTLSEGFKVRISNAGPGNVVFDKGGRLSFGNASRDSLTFQWDVVEVFITSIGGAPVFLQTYNLGLPVVYQYSNTAMTRNATAMVAIPGIAVPLDINAAYDIDLTVAFSSGITTNTLKLGLAAFPSGWTCALQGVVFNTNVQGTGPCVHKPMFTSSDAVAGVSGTSAVVSTNLLARITGRIFTGSTSGLLIPTCGSIATTGNVSVASGGANMSVMKVYDQGRT